MSRGVPQRCTEDDQSGCDPSAAASRGEPEAGIVLATNNRSLGGWRYRGAAILAHAGDVEGRGVRA